MAFTPPISAAFGRPLRPARGRWTAVRNDPAAMGRVAVADLGSNSWRLVVFGYQPGTPWWSLVDEIREAVRVRAGMGELLDAIRATTGLDPRVISGREEARYGWLAIANSTTISDGYGLDIGGGSIQALRIAGRRLADSESLPLGSVRVSEDMLPGEKAP